MVTIYNAQKAHACLTLRVGLPELNVLLPYQRRHSGISSLLLANREMGCAYDEGRRVIAEVLSALSQS